MSEQLAQLEKKGGKKIKKWYANAAYNARTYPYFAVSIPKEQIKGFSQVNARVAFLASNVTLSNNEYYVNIDDSNFQAVVAQQVYPINTTYTIPMSTIPDGGYLQLGGVANIGTGADYRGLVIEFTFS